MNNEIKIIKIPCSKRVFDIVMASFLLLLSLPLVLFIITWICVEQIFIKDSRGSLFYKEKRVSQGKIFEFYKWRTFKTKVILEALKNGPVIHTARMQADLKNLTYYGRFLKRIYMDELPQLWNVLRGDVSLIGPRPEFADPVAFYSQDIPYYNIRHIIKPGLSGWAQIKQEGEPHHGIDVEETRRKFSYDLYYIRNRNLWLDLSIGLKTIKILLSRKGV